MNRSWSESVLRGLRELRDAPVVVGRAERDRDGLPVLKGMHQRLGLLLVGPERREVTVLVVEIIQRALRAVAPRQQRGFEGILAQPFVGFLHIEIPHALEPRIREPARRVIAIHAGVVAPEHGERRHPARLLIHADVGLKSGRLPFGIEQQMQRLKRAERVPDPVVHIERARILVNLVIERAVVTSVLGDVDHALVGAIERGVEHAALRLRAALDLDLAEHFVPTILRGALDLVEAPCGNFLLQIRLRLLDADERDAVAELQRPRFSLARPGVSCPRRVTVNFTGALNSP